MLIRNLIGVWINWEIKNWAKWVKNRVQFEENRLEQVWTGPESQEPVHKSVDRPNQALNRKTLDPTENFGSRILSQLPWDLHFNPNS